MALTKVSRSLLNTGVADSSDATAISIDSSENVTLAGDIALADGKKIKFGDSTDYHISHNANGVTYVAGGTVEHNANTWRIKNLAGTETIFNAVADGAVTLYYDNSSRLYTHTSGVKLDEHLYLVDSKKIFLGTGDDLSIYHDGSNSYIEDSGTGDLYLSAADNFIVRKYGGSEVMIKGTADGAAELYYDDSKKLETVTGGVTVTGTLTATSLAGNVTTAAQTAITSLGTLTTLTVDNVIINGTTIGHTDDTDLMTVADGGLTVAGTIATGDIEITSTNRDSLHIRRNSSGGDAGINFENTSGNLAQIYAMSTGDVVIDAVADITLDAAGDQIRFKDAGTEIGHINMDSSNLTIRSTVSDKDIIFTGNDGGVSITALTLDMSEAGKATFNNGIVSNAGIVVDNITIDGTEIDLSSGDLTLDVAGTIYLDADGGSVAFLDGGTTIGSFANISSNFSISSAVSDQDLIFKGNDGGSTITALTLDMSEAGAATFNDKIIATELDISGNVDIDGTLETDNLTVGGAQGSDGQVLTSTGSGVGWESVSAGTTTLDGLSEAKHGGGSGDFAGSILISHDGTTGTLDNALYNTGYGYEVFDKITSGDSNTAIGFQAAYDLTSSSNNTLVGRLAGANVSTGGNHTLIGYSAGDAISDSVHNTAVGYEAQGASNGNYNTAIGDRALHATNGGDDNTAIGSRAHYGTANSATRNTVVGVSAMEGATTGSYNSALGVRALYLNSSGTENVAAGYLCMDANTTGSYNVAYGTNALGGNETGANNVAIGHESLMAYTGGDNVAIGYRAGKAATQSRCTYIGYDAGTAQNGSADNMAIGYMALSRQTTGANGNIAIGNYTGRAVVSSASTSQLLAIGHNVANNASAALAGYQNCFVGYNIASASGLAGAFRNTVLGANAVSDLTTGDNNTAVGNNAGHEVTSGGNNFFVGYNTGTSSSPGGAITTGNNEGVLGNSDVSKINVQVALTVASDERDKTDFNNLDLGLAFVNQLQPVTYKWDKRSKYLPRDEDGEITDRDITKVTPDGTHKESWLDVGFKAQAVNTLEESSGYKISDETNLTVSLSGDGNHYGLQYEKFIPILVKALQEADDKIDALETRIKTLEDA